ncbi:MAG TPA: hypothetical protein VH325_01470 [Bryobacteraceae bacterium]|nr:hypothetical protein [Bryobacteraceae bacterium]
MRLRLFLIGLLIAAACVAQNQYMQAGLDAEHDLTVALLRVREAQLRPVVTDGQAQEQKIRPAAELQKLIVSGGFGYAEVFSDQADSQINRVARDAVRIVRAAHPADFDQLAPSMMIIAGAMKPDWLQITMTEYVEALYAIAKNATFAQSARAVALKASAATR